MEATYGETGVQLQTGFVDGVVRFVVGGIQDVLPAVIQASLVVIVGVALASVLASKTYKAAVRLGLDERVEAGPFDGLFGPDRDAAASAVSSFVKFFVLAVALILAIGVLNLRELQTLNQTLLLYAPRVLAAALVGVVGLGVGRVAFRLVTNALEGRGVGETVSGTVLDSVFPAEGDRLARFGGRIVEYYVYLVTLFVVADVLRVGPLQELFAAATFYAPEVIAGVVVLVVGVVVAGVVADLVERSRTAQRTPAPGVVAEATKGVVVLLAAVVALDAAGVSTSLLTTVLYVVVLPLALGVALAAGLAFGYGSRDYVQQHIEDWT